MLFNAQSRFIVIQQNFQLAVAVNEVGRRTPELAIQGHHPVLGATEEIQYIRLLSDLEAVQERPRSCHVPSVVTKRR